MILDAPPLERFLGSGSGKAAAGAAHFRGTACGARGAAPVSTMTAYIFMPP